jgi:hypothetical protein
MALGISYYEYIISVHSCALNFRRRNFGGGFGGDYADEGAKGK